MKLTSNGRCWTFDAGVLGGLLLEMESEGFDEVDAPHLQPDHIDSFTKEPHLLATEDLVCAFKVALFLQADHKAGAFGKELSSRMSYFTYNQIRELSDYFEK